MVSSGERKVFPMKVSFAPGDAGSEYERCLGVMLPDTREGLQVRGWVGLGVLGELLEEVLVFSSSAQMISWTLVREWMWTVLVRRPLWTAEIDLRMEGRSKAVVGVVRWTEENVRTVSDGRARGWIIGRDFLVVDVSVSAAGDSGVGGSYDGLERSSSESRGRLYHKDLRDSHTRFDLKSIRETEGSSHSVAVPDIVGTLSHIGGILSDLGPITKKYASLAFLNVMVLGVSRAILP